MLYRVDLKQTAHIIFLCLSMWLPVKAFAIADMGIAEGFIGYRHDILEEQQYPFYGVLAYADADWFSVNSIVVSDPDVNVEPSVESFSLIVPYQFGRTYFNAIIGKIILPVGLYEVQRIFPTVVLPRTLNDSYYFTRFDDFVAKSNYGAIVELEVDDFSWNAAAYVQEVMPFKTYIDARSVSTLLTLFNDDFDPERPVDIDVDSVLTPVLDFINNVIVDPSNPVETLEESFQSSVPVYGTLERKTAFMSFVYDNRDDVILDLDFAFTINNIDAVVEKLITRELFVIASIEKRLGKRFFATQEVMYSKDLNVHKHEQLVYAASLLYDANRIAYHASYINEDGYLHNLNDWSAGVSVNMGRGAYMRVTYRNIAGMISEYTNLPTVYCDQTCTALTYDDENFLNVNGHLAPPAEQSSYSQYADAQNKKIDESGVEVRFIYNF